MDTKTFTIRVAKPKDAPLIAQIVAMAIGDELSLKDYCGEQYLKVLEEIALNEKTQYSFKNTLIAEIENVPIGAVIGYDGAKLFELRDYTFSIINQHLNKIPNMTAETQAGEFYLDSIAILPNYRGQGFGKDLISALCQKALAEGHENIGLLVDFENPKAENLYSKLGFKRINETEFLGHKMWHLQKKLK